MEQTFKILFHFFITFYLQADHVILIFYQFVSLQVPLIALFEVDTAKVIASYAVIHLLDFAHSLHLL